MIADRGLFRLLAGDGRPLLAAMASALIASGGFAVFIAARGEFLPHDVTYLGMTPQQLCSLNECRIVHFMIHDRIAFGGALLAIGTVKLWLIAGPLGNGQRWAWDLIAAGGAVGFLSFLAYLGTGYLDTWHATATLVLMPAFLGGLALKWKSLDRREAGSWFAAPVWWNAPRNLERVGRAMLLACAGGMIGGGATILTVGMTSVFVPEDLIFLGMRRSELDAVNPRLVPLIAHDRAGFGGAVCCGGVLLAGSAWRAKLDRAARQAMVVAGLAGFGTAIAVHPAIGYTNFFHLAPASAGAILFAVGFCLLPNSSPPE